MKTFFSGKMLLLAVFSIIGLTLLSGCGSGGNSSTPVTLNSIAVTPGSLTVTHGKTASLGATGTYTDGSTADLTSQVTWVSAAPGTAAVNSNGDVTGVAEGDTTITATLNGITSSPASITITAATLSSIALTPAPMTLPKGTSSNLHAIGTFSDGSSVDISTQVSWTSASIATATVGLTGTVTGVAVGSTTANASLNGITSPDASITVTDAILDSISITSAAILPKGTTTNLIATGTFSDGTTTDITTEVNWTSADPLTAAVGVNTGIVYGAAIGTTTVKAELGDITSSNTTDISVIAATLSSIAVSPVSADLPKGTSTPLTATGTYSDGSSAVINTVTWHSESIATASVSTDGTVTGVEVGSTKVYASSSSIDSNKADITVTPAVLTSIAVTPSPASLAKGASTNLTAIGTFSDSTTADITTQATWTTEVPATATVGTNSGVLTGVAVGNTTVSATLNGKDSPTVSIAVTPVTWNPADMGTEVSLTNGNLTATSTAAWYRAVRASLGISKGKAYWEVTPTYHSTVFGIMGPLANLESWVGSDTSGWGVYPINGNLYGSGKNPDWVATPISYGSVIGFGLDMDAGTLRIWVNGVDQGIAFTGLTGTVYPASTIYAAGATVNFGATPFVTNPLPDGYSADIFQH